MFGFHKNRTIIFRSERGIIFSCSVTRRIVEKPNIFEKDILIRGNFCLKIRLGKDVKKRIILIWKR